MRAHFSVGGAIRLRRLQFYWPEGYARVSQRLAALGELALEHIRVVEKGAVKPALDGCPNQESSFGGYIIQDTAGRRIGTVER